MRFINADPIGFAGGSNWYAYAGNSPLMFVDPSGFCRDSSGGGSWSNSMESYGKQFIGPMADGVPSKARAVFQPISKTGSPPMGFRGGSAFANDGRSAGQVLPRTNANGGTERIVIGSDGKAYYTGDHYKTFIPIQ
jgi:hypothetical protein